MTSSRPVQSVSNAELYNRWAKVYDSDGNILQALDDALLPALLSQAFSHFPADSNLVITELGCGTGRNTVKLLNPSLPPINKINALDLSPSMMAIARSRYRSLLESSAARNQQPKIEFHEFDALQPSTFPEIAELQGKANLVLSTLVLEHLPVDVFFRTIKGLLSEGGYAVITNMHAEMGRKGQAGFVDEEAGIKVRGNSFVYEVSEVVEEGKKWGFEVVGTVGERGVREEDVGEGRLVGVRGNKWIGCLCWFGFVVRLRGGVDDA